MGLSLEHSFQSTTLARCYNVELAACFAATVCTILECDLQEQAVSAGDDEKSQDVKKDFLHALANLDLLLAEEPDGEAIESIGADDERVDAARKDTQSTPRSRDIKRTSSILGRVRCCSRKPITTAPHSSSK